MRGMIHSSDRAANFSYAIRNVVNAAEKLERQGREIIHLNIGDPQSFGFKPTPTRRAYARHEKRSRSTLQRSDQRLRQTTFSLLQEHLKALNSC